MADGLTLRIDQTGPIPLTLDLHVNNGETLALIGPSGAGKTTALRAIAGLASVTNGQVSCNDDVWLDTEAGIAIPPRHRPIGLVFQSYALFPHLSARDNVAEAMPQLPASERASRAEELLRQVHLEGLGHRRPAHLSGGQQQRVALARALARNPQVLLLDEPLAAVDRPTRRAVQDLLAEIRRALPIPMILVTHDIDEAARMADTICFLQDGRQRDLGPAKAMIADPRCPLRQWLDS